MESMADIEKMIRRIIKEAFIDARGELGGFSFHKNKFYTHKVGDRDVKFLVSDNDEAKYPLLMRDNNVSNALGGGSNVKSFPHVRIMLSNGHLHDYVMIRDRIYPAYMVKDLLGNNRVDFDAHLKSMSLIRSIEDLDIIHFNNNYTDPEFLELKRRYPKLTTDIAVYENGREKIMDLFDILDITQKQYVAYLDDPNRTNKDGSVDASRAGIYHKVYNFIE